MLQADVASIRRRIGQLEDDELEIMELSEPIDAQRAELGAERERLEAETKRLTDDLNGAEAAIATQLETVCRERDDEAADVPADLWAEYDRLRSRLDGIAVARLVGTTCQGCHLQLSAVEIDRIRRLDVDELVHCEACGRLLVFRATVRPLTGRSGPARTISPILARRRSWGRRGLDADEPTAIGTHTVTPPER